MIKILELKNYTIPYCGNKRIQPYGDLVVTDGTYKKTARIMDDGAKQYITFNRKRYYIRNAGTLYAPRYVVVGSIEDAIAMLKEANYKIEIQSDNAVKVYYKDCTGEFTQITPCDESRDGYYMIEGRVQNLREWARR